LKPIPPPSGDRQTVSQEHMNGLFLEKPGLLKEALKREEEWSKKVPGYNYTLGTKTAPLSSLERSLFKLRAERELGEWADQFVDPDAMPEDDGTDGNGGKPVKYKQEDRVWEEGLEALRRGDQFDPDLPIFHQAAAVNGGGEAIAAGEGQETETTSLPLIVPTMISNRPCVKALPSELLVPGIGYTPIRRDPVIVIIRHGKTEHNKLGLFTGWDDVP